MNRKRKLLPSPVPESRCLKHDRTLIDSANTYCMPRTVQGIGNTNINVQRTLFLGGVLCAWNNLPVHPHLTDMYFHISLNNAFSGKASSDSPPPALFPLNLVCLSNVHQACSYSFGICILLDCKLLEIRSHVVLFTVLSAYEKFCTVLVSG